MILRILSMLAVLSINAQSAFAAPEKATKDQRARLEKALKLFESRDEEANVELIIIETDGSKKTRAIQIQRAGNFNEQRFIARITAPSDLKGTSLLSILSSQSENQWVYLPSTKQTRKVLTADHKDAGILGSEIRYEDFNPSVIRQTKVGFLKTEKRDGKEFDVFETKVPAGLSVYTTAQIWIDNSADVPAEIAYFIKNEKVKTIKFRDYRMIGDVKRPHHMIIANLKNNRGTEIKMADFQINKGLPVQRLSVESLSKSW